MLTEFLVENESKVSFKRVSKGVYQYGSIRVPVEIREEELYVDDVPILTFFNLHEDRELAQSKRNRRLPG